MKGTLLFILCLLALCPLFSQRVMFGDSPARPVTIGKSSLRPDLKIESISLGGGESNSVMYENEHHELVILLSNRGAGPAFGLVLEITPGKGAKDLLKSSILNAGFLKSNDQKQIRIPLQPKKHFKDGIVQFDVQVKESRGFETRPYSYEVRTKPHKTASPILIEPVPVKKLYPGKEASLIVSVENVGNRSTKSLTLELDFLNHEGTWAKEKSKVKWKNIKPGIVKEIEFSFSLYENINEDSLYISYKLMGEKGRETLSGVWAFKVYPMTPSPPFITDISTPGNDLIGRNVSDELLQRFPPKMPSDPDKIAVIIGNYDYKNQPKVKYAIRDAEAMFQYFTEVLGFSRSNIIFRTDATKSEMETIFGSESGASRSDELYQKIKEGKSKVYVYFSGHGIPNVEGKNIGEAFLMPVDGQSHHLNRTAYSLKTLYKNLDQLPAKEVVVLLEACFSGELHDIISPVVLTKIPKVKKPNMVVLSATQDDQPANWYEDKGHGLFTWHVLQTIQNPSLYDTDQDGSLSLWEVYEAISHTEEGIPAKANYKQEPFLQGNHKDIIIYKYK